MQPLPPALRHGMFSLSGILILYMHAQVKTHIISMPQSPGRRCSRRLSLLPRAAGASSALREVTLAYAQLLELSLHGYDPSHTHMLCATYRTLLAQHACVDGLRMHVHLQSVLI